MGNLRSAQPGAQLDVAGPASASAGAPTPHAAGYPIDSPVDARMRASLEVLVRLIERVAPGMHGSVLLLDDDGVTLRHGAAPNLPLAYCSLIDGEKIGPAAGSCGTAAYRGEQVIVREIATDPLWADYRAAAAPFGLAACWSTPILDGDDRVLGTFAMYYGEPRSPTAADLELTGIATHLASGIISEARAVAALRKGSALLRSSQERLRAALDASSTCTWRWDMATGVVDGDEGLFALFGVDPAKAGGSFDAFVANIHPEDRDGVIAGATRCATEGADLDEEFRIVRPDGSLRWAVDKGKVVLGDDGKPAYLIGACVDVTERRVRDEQFRALAESIPQLAWMADPTGARDWFNQRWLDYTGMAPADARGFGWRAIYHPDHVDRVVAGIRRAWASGEPWEDTFQLRGRDGNYRWFLGRAQPIRDADGQLVRWFGTSTDINELREAQLARDRALAEARRERERLYEVFMQAPAAIAVLEGPEYRFAVSNPLYRKLIGDRDALGRTLLEALPELREQGVVEQLDQVRASGRPLSASEVAVRFDRDGDDVPDDCYVDYVYQPLTDGAGDVFGILVLAIDVTLQVQSRLAIAAARADAERANKAKSAFLAGMSHDLRTPLGAIGGFADLTADGVYGPVNDAQRGAMTRIRSAGDHLLALINDILTFAKIEAGRVRLDIASVDVSDVVAAAIELTEVQAAKKGLTLASHASRDDVSIEADRERVLQILVNLLTNALKFTAAGSVSVAWRADEALAYIDVIDTGRGIPADKLSSIFEPFVQAGRSQEEQQQGVGLGLATSRELARAMSGELTVSSRVGQGSTFTLSLPRSARPTTQ